ncbi:insulinase family protein [Pannonibacter sp. Pt2-lr]
MTLPAARRRGLLFATALSCLVLGSGLSMAQTAAEKPPVIAPNLSSFTLDNGLEVVVIPDHRAPVVTHMIWYKTGAADEPAGQSGVAHFLEHLMFKGTKRIRMVFSRRSSPISAVRKMPSPATTTPPISSAWPRNTCRA